MPLPYDVHRRGSIADEGDSAGSLPEQVFPMPVRAPVACRPNRYLFFDIAVRVLGLNAALEYQSLSF
jgi:hypothetical protein